MPSSIRRLVRGSAKSALESLSGYNVWLEPSSDLAKVRALIRRLAPIPITKPMLRIGSADDGGYLAPDDFDEITAAVSPGVSTEISFDLEMAHRGIEVYMADASVDGPPIESHRFHFSKKFVDVFDDQTHMRLDSLCASIPPEHDGDRILQMDIEGAEYQALLDLSDDVLRSFRIMLIEFHGLDRMFAAFPFQIIKATFEKLLRFHHVVHLHPNNFCNPRVRGDLEIPPVMEFTFYRKDRVTADLERSLSFPHPLDRDNVPGLPSVVLPMCWR